MRDRTGEHIIWEIIQTKHGRVASVFCLQKVSTPQFEEREVCDRVKGYGEKKFTDRRFLSCL